MTRDPLENGELLDGKYRIGEVLGRTARSIVFLARHEELDRPVAIKLLLGDAVGDETLLARFRREAKVLAKVESPHVVRLFDVGSFGTSAPYIVMERLIGEDLLSALEREGRLSIGRACHLMVQAAAGLAAAHEAGIVHRDVKPSNLFVTRTAAGQELVKVIDFGVAKLDAPVSRRDGALTEGDVRVGSPRYMSPEQVNGAAILDARCDIWSLAVVFCESITGKALFVGDTLWKIFASISETDAPSLLDLVPTAPPALAAALKSALQRDPAKRTADARAFAAALAPFAVADEQKGLPRSTEGGHTADDATTGTRVVTNVTLDIDPDPDSVDAPAPPESELTIELAIAPPVAKVASTRSAAAAAAPLRDYHTTRERLHLAASVLLLLALLALGLLVVRARISAEDVPVRPPPAAPSRAQR